jgi:hypothetical protein
VRLISEAVRVNEQQPEIVRLYTVLSAEALAEDHPAHDYFQRRYATTRENLARGMQWHPRPDQAAVQVHSYLDGIQLDWLQNPKLNLSELWEGYASLLLQGGARP